MNHYIAFKKNHINFLTSAMKHILFKRWFIMITVL